MSFFYSKLLPLLVYPLGAAIFLGLVALAMSFTRHRAVTRAVLALALVGLWVASTPTFSYALAAWMEADFTPTDPANLPRADAIILLGGLSVQRSPAGDIDLLNSADRLVLAVRLFRAGRAPRIVVSGGNLPWSTDVEPEADRIADLLVEFGVPRENLVLETGSRNTHENAVNTAAVFKRDNWTSGLLVTSAFHMRRALAAFQQSGIDVTPAATDFRGRNPAYTTALDLLPDADSLARTTIFVKEIIGIWVYRLRGWA